MAGISSTRTINPTYTVDKVIIDPYQTTNATQSTAYSMPIGQSQGASVTVSFTAINSGFSNIAAGKIEATFLRASGNLSRTAVTSNAGLMQSVLGNFTGTQPSVDIAADTGTNAIDFKVTGKVSATINWNLEIEIKYSNFN